MSKGEKIAIVAGIAGIIVTTLAALAYIVGIIPINNVGHFWTHLMFVSVFSLILYSSFMATIGIALRRALKRRRLSKTLWGMEDFNIASGFLIMVLWVPVFILWLFIAIELAYPPGTKSTAGEFVGLAVYLLPTTAIGIAFFCYMVDELFNPGPQ